MRNILDIYSIREKWARDRQYPIFGFKELLHNLRQTKEEFVIIHRVESEKFTFDIFTDPQIETLFGIIAIDESTNWRGGRSRPWSKDFHEPTFLVGRKS